VKNALSHRHENRHHRKKIPTGIADENGEMSLAAGDGSIWLLSDSLGVLSRISPASNALQTKIMVKPHSYCAGFGFHSVWVTNTRDNSVQRIDCKTDSVISVLPVGSGPRFLAIGEKAVWTLNQGDGTVTRIDPTSGKEIVPSTLRPRDREATLPPAAVKCGSYPKTRTDRFKRSTR